MVSVYSVVKGIVLEKVGRRKVSLNIYKSKQSEGESWGDPGKEDFWQGGDPVKLLCARSILRGIWCGWSRVWDGKVAGSEIREIQRALSEMGKWVWVEELRGYDLHFKIITLASVRRLSYSGIGWKQGDQWRECCNSPGKRRREVVLEYWWQE